MENVTIKQEPSRTDDIAMKDELGFDNDEPSSSNSLTNVPQHNPAMASWNTAASNAYDPSGAKPPRGRRNRKNSAEIEMQRISSARKEAKQRKEQLRSTHKERTASIQQRMKQYEEPERTTNRSDIMGGIERMHITLPPLSQFIPSSSLTLAPLLFETKASAPTTEAKERVPNFVRRKGTTTGKATKPLSDMADLIKKAIFSAPDHRLTSPQIFHWITENHPDHLHRNSKYYIGQCLSRRDEIFKPVGKTGHCYIWTVLPEMEAGSV